MTEFIYKTVMKEVTKELKKEYNTSMEENDKKDYTFKNISDIDKLLEELGERWLKKLENSKVIIKNNDNNIFL